MENETTVADYIIEFNRRYDTNRDTHCPTCGKEVESDER